MKLDVNVLRYLSKDEFRVLTAVEMGQKNHEIVPLPLIDNISGLKHGGAFKCVKVLLRHKLLHHDNTKYDGYRLTNLGYDFLAIKTLANRGHISSLGRQIGIGKESDIWEVMNEDGEVMALKLHRLGRTSFRAVKSKRDYLGKRHSFSWLYMSRLAALKEYAFMRALGDHGFCVPTAIDQNRHAVLMSLEDAYPLAQVKDLGHPGVVYQSCMAMITRLAGKGLIHCDFNEFNLLVREDETVVLIDFPQMVSTLHPNGKELFERDVECVHRFFTKKIGYIPELEECHIPVFEDVAYLGRDGLDTELKASGFSSKQQQQLEEYLAQTGTQDEGSADEDEDENDDGNDDENDDENDDINDEQEVLDQGEEVENDGQDVVSESERKFFKLQVGAGSSSLGDDAGGENARGGGDEQGEVSISNREEAITGSGRNSSNDTAGIGPEECSVREGLEGNADEEGLRNEESQSGVEGEGRGNVGGSVGDSVGTGMGPGSEAGFSYSTSASGHVGNGPQATMVRQRILAEARAAARQGSGSRVMQNTNKAKNRGGKVSASNSIFG